MRFGTNPNLDLDITGLSESSIFQHVDRERSFFENITEKSVDRFS